MAATLGWCVSQQLGSPVTPGVFPAPCPRARHICILRELPLPGPGELGAPNPSTCSGSRRSWGPPCSPLASGTAVFPEGRQERRSPGAAVAAPAPFQTLVPSGWHLRPACLHPLPKHQGPPTARRGPGCPQHKAGDKRAAPPGR